MSNIESMVEIGHTDVKDAEITQIKKEIVDDAYLDAVQNKRNRIENDKRNPVELENNNLPAQSQVKMELVNSSGEEEEEEEEEEETNNHNLDLDIHYNYGEIKIEYQLDRIESNFLQINDPLGSEPIHNNEPLRNEEFAVMDYKSQPSLSSESSPIENNSKSDSRRRRKMQIEIRNEEFFSPPLFFDDWEATFEDDHQVTNVSEIEKKRRHSTVVSGEKKNIRRDSDKMKRRKDKCEIVQECVFVCSICEKSFASKFLLKKHSNTHAPSNLCPVCGKIFAHQHNMATHMRVHTGERPYHCTLCDRKFSRKEHLNRHMDSHSGVRPYRCEVCEKTFRRNTHLNRHTKVHSGVKPYSCMVCGKTFVELRRVKEHMAQRHKY